MKTSYIKDFFSANPNRDWALVLFLLVVLLVILSVLDARFFLSATKKVEVEAVNNASFQFDKNALKKAVADRKSQENKFNGL